MQIDLKGIFRKKHPYHVIRNLYLCCFQLENDVVVVEHRYTYDHYSSPHCVW